MIDYSSAIVAPSARWSCRLALFSVGLLLVGLVLHRATSVETDVTMNLFVVGFASAALAMLIGLAALVQIWRTGFGGMGSMALGIFLPILAFAGPVGYAVAHSHLPLINDITTDFVSPPQFVALAGRPAGANSASYPGAHFADLQTKAYPEVRPLVIERSPQEAFELVEEAVQKLRWQVAAAEPPRSAQPGRLEATDQTLIVGFTDDVVIRVQGNRNRTRIDVRSASRYGRADFGANATRIRRLLAEVQMREEATVPGRGGATARARTLLKRKRAAGRQKAESRSGRDRDRSNARREPAPRERQR